MASAGESPREMLADLAARGDELSARVATALKTLVDDLAKAHADAASSAVNNEQRFHQLEHETVAARSETERMTKLKEDAERRGEQSEARVTALTNEVPAGVCCRRWARGADVRADISAGGCGQRQGIDRSGRAAHSDAAAGGGKAR
jgi:hypothetical protein